MIEQWWLAKVDQYGNATLFDGAHQSRAGADRAMFLLQRMGIAKPGQKYAVARVELSEPQPSADGVDLQAADRCAAMLKRPGIND